MSDFKKQNHYPLFLNVANQTVVADTVAPLSAPISHKSLAVYIRIFATHEIFLNPAVQQGACGLIQLL